MSFLQKLSDSRFLTRLILLVGSLLILVVAVFAAIYYWDRYIHLGDESPIQRSLSELEQAVRDNPNDIEARMSLAEMYLVDKQYGDAIKQASQVNNAEPTNERSLFVLGIAYASTGKFTQAIPALETFTEGRLTGPMANSDQALEAALYYLGASYIETNQSEAAIKSLNQALVINQTDADAMYKLGQAYARSNQPDQAIVQYEKAVRFVPDFQEAYQGMLEIYLTQNKIEYVNYARGMLAYSQRDLKKAQSELEASAAVLDRYAPVHLGLGLTYEAIGAAEKSIQSLNKALELDPNNFMAQQALGRVQGK